MDNSLCVCWQIANNSITESLLCLNAYIGVLATQVIVQEIRKAPIKGMSDHSSSEHRRMRKAAIGRHRYHVKVTDAIIHITIRHSKNMAQLDIDWLGVYVEVYKTQSVSLAAERLGITQARASGILGKLRRYFGDELFARTSRGMQPTPYAERIYPDIVQAFEKLSAPKSNRDLFDPATAVRQFHICMTDISEIVVLPSLARDIRQLSAGVTIEAERISTESAARLESGDVDLAVGYMPSLEAGFFQQGLFKQGFVCLASKHHPRIQARPNKQAFCREGHIVVTTSGTGHAIVEQEFARRRIERDIVLRVPSFLGVARLVAQTELLAIVPLRLAEVLVDQEEINIFGPPVDLPSYTVKLHWHARFHADVGNIWMRKLIARVLKV